MANQLKLVATIAPANTAVEASTDSGTTWRAVAMSTVGSQQEGVLTNVPAGTYAAGVVRLRAVATPTVGAATTAAQTVAAAAAAAAISLVDADVLDSPMRHLDETGAYTQHSPLATFDIDATGNDFRFSIASRISEAGFPAPISFISVYDAAGAFVTYADPALRQLTPQDVTVLLPGTGTRRFRVVQSGNSRGGAFQAGSQEQTYRGGEVLSITGLNGAVVAKAARPAAANRAVFFTDSIFGVGDGTTNSSRYASLQQLRALMGGSWELAADGAGSWRISGAFETVALRQDAAQRAVAYLAGATGRRLVVNTMGTNDTGLQPYLGVTFTQVAEMMGDIFDRMHALDPTIICLFGTRLARADRDNTFAAPDNAAFKTAATTAARAGYVRFVDRLAWVNTTTDMNTDGLHPNNAGAGKDAANWQTQINAAIAPAVQLLTVEDTGAGYAYGAGWQALAGIAVYSQGTAHYIGAGNVTPSTYTLPQNATAIEFWWPLQTAEVSIRVSVNGGPETVYGTPINATNEPSALQATLVGTFAAGAVVTFKAQAAGSALAIIDKLVLHLGDTGTTATPAGGALRPVEDTEPGFVFGGGWQALTGISVYSQGTTHYTAIVDNPNLSTYTLPVACASIDFWWPLNNDAVKNLMRVDGGPAVLQSTPANPTNEPSVKQAALVGPFTAGQVISWQIAPGGGCISVIDKLVLHL